MCLLAELTYIFARFCEELAIRPGYLKKVRYSQEYKTAGQKIEANRKMPPNLAGTGLGKR